MHGHCSSCIPYFINFTFCAFFSLSSLCKTNWLLSSSLIIFFLRYTQTQTHPHTNTNTPTDKSSQRVPCPGPVSKTSSSSLSCRVTRLSLTQWVRAPSIRRVLWILGPSLRRHKGGEVSYGLKKSTGIRFSLFFCFGGDVGFDQWCGFDWWCGFWEKEEEKERRRRIG